MQPDQPALPTFIDHVHELRGRLFWIAVIFIISAIAAYPFIDAVITFLTAPLKGQELYYLTPVGGFSFLIKICTYVGAVITMPAIIFHLYKYLQPAIGPVKKRVLFAYVLFSSILATSGVLFAYYVSLPAALYFLTGLNLTSVTAMLTIDSYYSFIMTYMIGAAVLFQLPLVLLLINSVNPLKPSKLMGYQRHVILGAFIAAAIISPTPDMTNQALLAVPVILMYQVGIALIFINNKMKRNKVKTRRSVQNKVNASRSQQSVAPLITDAPFLAPASSDPYAWIDEMLEEEEGQAAVQQQRVSPSVQIKKTVGTEFNKATPLQKKAVLAQATPVMPTPAPVVEAIKHQPRRGYAMDFGPPSRSKLRASSRPIPSVPRAKSMQPATTIGAQFSPPENAMKQMPQSSVRYTDGVSVPLQSLI